MNLENMNKTEKSLLLYLEDRAVNNGGTVATAHMNQEDMKIAEKWNEEGFVGFGRICFEDIPSKTSTHWCNLSDEAWRVVAELRKNRAKRIWDKRKFKTTEEIRRED